MLCVEQMLADECPLLIAGTKISGACLGIDSVVVAQHVQCMDCFELDPPASMARRTFLQPGAPVRVDGKTETTLAMAG